MKKFIEITKKKLEKNMLSEDEIKYAVSYISESKVDSPELVEFIKAVYENSLNKTELFLLTKYMKESGDEIDLSPLNALMVDKHSTGGVSDSVSLVLMPMVALCGKIKMAKMSGRGLGFTGGTVDKLEAFSGLNIDLSEAKFKELVDKLGACIMMQTEKIAVVDKKMYAIRDVNGYVDNIGLIASSIMSKKLATGSDIILLDVKFGEGAFMKNLSSAKKLSKAMIDIGSKFGKKVKAIITNMNSPLGNGIGSIFEIKDVLNALNGENSDLKNLAVYMLKEFMIMSEMFTEKEILKVENKLYKIEENGKTAVRNKFDEIIAELGGDVAAFEEEYNKEEFRVIKSKFTGYISNIRARRLAEIVNDLGGGRKKVGDSINHSVGLKTLLNIGDYVYEGDDLILLSSEEKKYDDEVLGCIEISKEKPKKKKLIYEVIV